MLSYQKPDGQWVFLDTNDVKMSKNNLITILEAIKDNTDLEVIEAINHIKWQIKHFDSNITRWSPEGNEKETSKYVLGPCPFCNRNKGQLDIRYNKDGEPREVSVKCKFCYGSTPSYGVRKNLDEISNTVVNMWNGVHGKKETRFEGTYKKVSDLLVKTSPESPEEKIHNNAILEVLKIIDEDYQKGSLDV